MILGFFHVHQFDVATGTMQMKAALARHFLSQVLLAYFKGVPLEECVNLEMPMNTVVEFLPHQYGWLERRYAFTKAKLDDAASSTHIVW